LSVYSSTTDSILTMTAASATYDPMMKFRTGVSPSVQFSLGVDTADSNKFKIYSGDGISGTSEFSIDTNGVTSISNLQMGAQSFETNAGAVTWIDMPVTSAASDGTVESYTAMLGGNSMLTIYGTMSSGTVINRGVGIGTTAPGQTLTVNGTFGILETGTTPTYHTIFQGGDQAGDITYTLPTASSTGFLKNTSGTLSWDTGTYPTGSGTTNYATYWSGTNTLGSEQYLNVSRGGTGISTTGLTGVPTISSGTWSVDTNYLSLAHGGTNANLTASNGGIVWSNATQMQVLSGTATAGLALISGANATPSWYAPTAGSLIFA
jgi:hypothetical protein